jgi:hypothetical protein
MLVKTKFSLLGSAILWNVFLSLVGNDEHRFHMLEQSRIRKPLPQFQNVAKTWKQQLFFQPLWYSWRLQRTYVTHTFNYIPSMPS